MTEEIDENMPPLDDEVNEENQEVEAVAEEAESSPAEQEEAPAELNGVQERINKITADKYAEKRRGDSLAKENEELKSRLSETAPIGSEPTLEQYDYDDAKYQQALIDHKVKQGFQEYEQKQQQAQVEARQRQEQERLAKAQADYVQRSEKFKKQAPDFQEKVNALPEFQDETFQAILTAEEGPKLAYYLGSHLDVADKIANASPVEAAMMLGRISATLETVKPINNSAAPDPIETASSGGSLQKDISEMTMDEIYAL